MGQRDRRGKGKRGNQRSKGAQRPAGGDDTIWVYGVHPVEEYLDLGGGVERLYVARQRQVPQELMERIEREGIRHEEVEIEEIEELFEQHGLRGSHQGIVLRGEAFAYGDLDEVMEGLSDREEIVILALDQVQDVGNLGAILRSAAAFGVDAVLIPEHRAASVNGAVIRASAGQALRVAVVRVGNMTRALQQLKQDHRCWVMGTLLAEEKSVKPWEVDLSGTRAVWIVGGEHGGIRRLVGEQCDHLVEIPMAAGVESLNVASAASVVLYETWRQQKAGK